MITIQKPTKEDAEGIQQVFYKTWLATYPNAKAGVTVEDVEEKFKNRFLPETIAKIISNITDPSENNLFLVAKDQEKIIGVCRAKKEELHNQLMAIYVLPDYQRRGIGKMFWDKVIDFFGKDKDVVVHVVTYNTQAINFYKKLGFAETDKRFVEERFKMPISGAILPEMELVMKI